MLRQASSAGRAIVEASFLYDFFVTTLWEINGELVSSNQPSGRVITLPNSVVLSSHVHNYSYRDFPHVWNELSVQVAYETDLEFARSLMIEEATDYLGEDMQRAIERYRERLAETPVELEVRDRPSVNVVQEESWVDLRSGISSTREPDSASATTSTNGSSSG